MRKNDFVIHGSIITTKGSDPKVSIGQIMDFVNRNFDGLYIELNGIVIRDLTKEDIEETKDD